VKSEALRILNPEGFFQENVGTFLDRQEKYQKKPA